MVYGHEEILVLVEFLLLPGKAAGCIRKEILADTKNWVFVHILQSR